MKDVPLTALVRQIPVGSVSVVDVRGVPALLLTGEGLSSPESISMNGHPARTWVALGQRQLLVEIPQAAANQRLTALEVRVQNPEPGEEMGVAFGLQDGAVPVDGARRAVQSFLARLLTRKGSRAYRRSYGTRIHDALGVPEDRARQMVVAAVSDALVQCAREQDPRYPPEESIVAASVQRVARSGDQLRADLRLETGSGIVVEITQGVR